MKEGLAAFLKTLASRGAAFTIVWVQRAVVRIRTAAGEIWTWLLARRGWVTVAVATAIVIVVLFPEAVRERYEAVTMNLSSPSGDAGLILLETPQLFTRGRLVNDRFVEGTWLEGQLEKTNDLIKDDRFAGPDYIIFARKNLEIALGTRGAESPSSETKDEVRNRLAALGLRTPPLDQFEDAVRYRTAIRNVLMSTALDDRHDIDGNTVYRLNFNVTVVPPRGSNQLAVVVANLSQAGNTDSLDKSNLDLLRDWKERLQQQLQDLIRDRRETIGRGLDLEPKENVDFQTQLDRETDELLNDLGANDKSMRSRISEDFRKAYRRLMRSDELAEIDSSLKRIAGLRNAIEMDRKETQANLESGKIPVESKSRQSNYLLEYSSLINTVIAQCAQTTTGQLDPASLPYVKPGDFERTQGAPAGSNKAEAQVTEQFRCPSKPSPFMMGIDLLDAVQAIKMSRAGIDKTCFQAANLPDLVLAAGIRSFAGKQPSCMQAGKIVYQFRYSTDLPKRRNDVIGAITARIIEEQLRHTKLKLGNEEARRDSAGTLESAYEYLGGLLGNALKQSERKPNSEAPDKKNAEARLSDIFRIDFQHACVPGACVPLVKFNSAEDRGEPLVRVLRRLKRGPAFTYAVMPNRLVQRSEVQERSASQVSGDVKGPSLFQMTGRASSDVDTIGMEREPTIIGFGDWGSALGNSDGMSQFGWAVFPKSSPKDGSVKRTAPDNVSVSALISLPGWWQTGHLRVRTCWVSQADLRGTLDLNAICPIRRSRPSYVLDLKLPGDASELNKYLGFVVLKTPYLDRQDMELAAEVGRPAHIVIRGGRLWRSPVVQLGTQMAKRIEVLPDMRGIIAHFDCVLPEPGTYGSIEFASTDANAAHSDRVNIDPPTVPQTRTLLQVITSEGKTGQVGVLMKPFTRRAGETGLNPCWPKLQPRGLDDVASDKDMAKK
ncbi:MAG: hypothetical protein IH605_12465 [Burkholderiales bacterium]|nr:hypothetical protein [Burkholderiales bacterium]